MATQSFTKEFTISKKDAETLSKVLSSKQEIIIKKDYTSQYIDEDKSLKFFYEINLLSLKKWIYLVLILCLQNIIMHNYY